ncbi:Uncharacterised protein [Mycobacteroides abscessus subsp. abscessus]|nr:Uncharacterised protein [Mycobacteroides abscessus subsp. abscessus]
MTVGGVVRGHRLGVARRRGQFIERMPRAYTARDLQRGQSALLAEVHEGLGSFRPTCRGAARFDVDVLGQNGVQIGDRVDEQCVSWQCAVVCLRRVAEPVGNELTAHLLHRDLRIHDKVGESL